MGVGSDIDINPHIGGDVTITAPGMGASISAGTSPQGEGTHVTINKNAKGTVKILGEIQARGQGTTVLANLTGDGPLSIQKPMISAAESLQKTPLACPMGQKWISM